MAATSQSTAASPQERAPNSLQLPLEPDRAVSAAGAGAHAREGLGIAPSLPFAAIVGPARVIQIPPATHPPALMRAAARVWPSVKIRVQTSMRRFFVFVPSNATARQLKKVVAAEYSKLYAILQPSSCKAFEVLSISVLPQLPVQPAQSRYVLSRLVPDQEFLHDDVVVYTAMLAQQSEFVFAVLQPALGRSTDIASPFPLSTPAVAAAVALTGASPGSNLTSARTRPKRSRATEQPSFLFSLAEERPAADARWVLGCWGDPAPCSTSSEQLQAPTPPSPASLSTRLSSEQLLPFAWIGPRSSASIPWLAKAHNEPIRTARLHGAGIRAGSVASSAPIAASDYVSAASSVSASIGTINQSVEHVDGATASTARAASLWPVLQTLIRAGGSEAGCTVSDRVASLLAHCSCCAPELVPWLARWFSTWPGVGVPSSSPLAQVFALSTPPSHVACDAVVRHALLSARAMRATAAAAHCDHMQQQRARIGALFIAPELQALQQTSDGDDCVAWLKHNFKEDLFCVPERLAAAYLLGFRMTCNHVWLLKHSSIFQSNTSNDSYRAWCAGVVGAVLAEVGIVSSATHLFTQ